MYNMAMNQNNPETGWLGYIVDDDQAVAKSIALNLQKRLPNSLSVQAKAPEELVTDFLMGDRKTLQKLAEKIAFIIVDQNLNDEQQTQQVFELISFLVMLNQALVVLEMSGFESFLPRSSVSQLVFNKIAIDYSTLPTFNSIPELLNGLRAVEKAYTTPYGVQQATDAAKFLELPESDRAKHSHLTLNYIRLRTFETNQLYNTAPQTRDHVISLLIADDPMHVLPKHRVDHALTMLRNPETVQAHPEYWDATLELIHEYAGAIMHAYNLVLKYETTADSNLDELNLGAIPLRYARLLENFPELFTPVPPEHS